MNKFHALLAASALGATVLTGCASNDALMSEIDALKAQQAKLANDVAFIKSDAARANERLDNLARRYKK